MANRHRRAGVQQEEGHGLSYDFAASDDHRAFAGNLNVGTLEKLHDTGWRAGARGRPVRNKTADIEGMKAIGIF